MKILKISLIGIFSFTLIGFIFLSSSSTAKVKMFNKSSEEIQKGKISLCNEHVEVTNTPTASEVSFELKIKGDCHYTIEIQFKSGKKVSGEVGYTSSGANYEHDIFVYDDKIELVRTKTI